MEYKLPNTPASFDVFPKLPITFNYAPKCPGHLPSLQMILFPLSFFTLFFSSKSTLSWRSYLRKREGGRQWGIWRNNENLWVVLAMKKNTGVCGVSPV